MKGAPSAAIVRSDNQGITTCQPRAPAGLVVMPFVGDKLNTIMKMLAHDIPLKRELLSRYVLPALGLAMPAKTPLAADLARCCHLFSAERYEMLEKPGGWHGGHLYWFEWMLAHSYFLEGWDGKQPLELLVPDTVLLDTDALLHHEDRYAYVQALEAGRGLRISYASLRALMGIHPALRGAIERMAERNDVYLRSLAQRAALPVAERIEHFTRLYSPWQHRLTLEVQLLHMQVDEDTFRNFMRRNGMPYTSLRLHKMAENAISNT